MVYITVKQSPRYHQMTLEEFYFPEKRSHQTYVDQNETNTRTYAVENVSARFLDTVNVPSLIRILKQFNTSTEELRKSPRKDLYRTFYIPKKSGGLRKIDAPNDDLMETLRKLKLIFERDFGALYHTSAFAYVKGRSPLDAVKRHQQNESRWFLKLDLHNFFGSTTLDFVMRQLSMVFPFSEVIRQPDGETELRKALDLAFLNGVLPQGTPISPLITNVMMIPIDYTLSNGLRKHKNKFVETRYADDFTISSMYDFSVQEVKEFVVRTLSEFNAPFRLNDEKTRYGSSSGSNWNLGVMLNKDNQITIGYKNKRRFKAMLSSFVVDTTSGNKWDPHDVQVLDGYMNYYKNVEGQPIQDLIDHIGEKYHVNIKQMIRAELHP